jgi:putative transposase
MDKSLGCQDHAAYPVRRSLCHEIPGWVGSGCRHFITINCRQRGSFSLVSPSIATALLGSLTVYEERGRWYPWLAVVMPDHFHLIVTFDLTIGIRRTVSAWKRYLARSQNLNWQSDFFEHRLRNDAEFLEKASYVRQNPVRQGLVEKPEDWPFFWERSGRQVAADNVKRVGRALRASRGGAETLPRRGRPIVQKMAEMEIMKGSVSSPSEPGRSGDGSPGGVALPCRKWQR